MVPGEGRVRHQHLVRGHRPAPDVRIKVPHPVDDVGRREAQGGEEADDAPLAVVRVVDGEPRLGVGGVGGVEEAGEGGEQRVQVLVGLSGMLGVLVLG